MKRLKFVTFIKHLRPPEKLGINRNSANVRIEFEEITSELHFTWQDVNCINTEPQTGFKYWIVYSGGKRFEINENDIKRTK